MLLMDKSTIWTGPFSITMYITYYQRVLNVNDDTYCISFDIMMKLVDMILGILFFRKFIL